MATKISVSHFCNIITNLLDKHPRQEYGQKTVPQEYHATCHCSPTEQTLESTSASSLLATTLMTSSLQHAQGGGKK